MTVLSLAPSILVMVTVFTRIIVVLHFTRQTVGTQTQTSPSNMVIAGLALFLTGFVMQPTLEKAYYEGIVPLVEGEIDENEAPERIIAPFHGFMICNVREVDVALFMDISKTRRAFEIGFLIYIPFVVIDMVIASLLMSMGMMMLPPAILALPFKLIFFVLVDGLALLVGSLVQSFSP
ncbi:MAG: flagellar biosynthetic protein FliP [Rhodospirillaceae bacterium]|nr:MAG: flagellar biosynthetic protein FliP [Rhodospirillaceae bacterium]